MKKLLILAGVIALTATTQVFAQENAAPQGPCPCPNQEAPQPPEFGCPEKMHRPPCDMKKFESELKLTDEQKAKIKQFKDRDEALIRPIKEQIKVKHQEIDAIFKEKLTLQERQDKLAPIHRDIDQLKGQIRVIREQGKKDFESVLTSKQVKKLDKLKAQAKKDFEKNIEKGDMHRPPMPQCNCGCSKPPVEK